MKPINDGGSAFPTKYDAYNNSPAHCIEGMTLRDYFAGQVLVGLLASEAEGFTIITEEDKTNEETIASIAYKFADAMLKARSNGKT